MILEMELKTGKRGIKGMSGWDGGYLNEAKTERIAG